MPASKAQQKAVAKYMKTNYDELKVLIPKGEKEIYEVEKNKGSTTYSILPDVTDFKVNGETWQPGMRLRI